MTESIRQLRNLLALSNTMNDDERGAFTNAIDSVEDDYEELRIIVGLCINASLDASQALERHCDKSLTNDTPEQSGGGGFGDEEI